MQCKQNVLSMSHLHIQWVVSILAALHGEKHLSEGAKTMIWGDFRVPVEKIKRKNCVEKIKRKTF